MQLEFYDDEYELPCHDFDQAPQNLQVSFARPAEDAENIEATIDAAVQNQLIPNLIKWAPPVGQITSSHMGSWQVRIGAHPDDGSKAILTFEMVVVLSCPEENPAPTSLVYAWPSTSMRLIGGPSV